MKEMAIIKLKILSCIVWKIRRVNEPWSPQEVLENSHGVGERNAQLFEKWVWDKMIWWLRIASTKLNITAHGNGTSQSSKALFQPIALTNCGQPCNNQQYSCLHPTSFNSGFNLLRYEFNMLFCFTEYLLLFMGMVAGSPDDDIDTTPSGFAFCWHVLV